MYETAVSGEAPASKVIIYCPKEGDKRNQSLNTSKPDSYKIEAEYVPEMA